MSDKLVRNERRELLKLAAAGLALSAVGSRTAQAQENPFRGQPVTDAPFGVRRVITGHDDNGKAIVSIDDFLPFEGGGRVSQAGTDVWSTSTLPADINAEGDFGEGNLAENARSDGSILRITRYGVGVGPRMHRTAANLDYVFVMYGSIDMEMDDGEIVRLKQGDVLVQRGTIHNWINHGPEHCIVGFVLMASTRVEINGNPLENFNA